MQSCVSCMTFWPLALALLSLWCFIICPRLLLIPCRMPFESCLWHFVGEWEFFFGIHVHFKELYVFGMKLVTMATIVKGYWPSVIIWEVFTPTLWTFFGHSYIYFQLSNFYFNVYNCMFGSDLCTISDWYVVPFTRGLHDFSPISLPIMSMWSFFISPRLTLIPFRMHFESCWYNWYNL